MSRPLYEIGQRVAVYCARSGDIYPATKVIDREWVGEGQTRQEFTGKFIRATAGAWVYEVADDPGYVFAERHLRPIHDDEYRESEHQSNSLKTPNREGVKA